MYTDIRSRIAVVLRRPTLEWFAFRNPVREYNVRNKLLVDSKGSEILLEMFS